LRANGLEHGDAVFAAAAHVVNLTGARFGSKFLDSADDVIAMDIVTNKFGP
jgi:hypothetical protein